MCASGLLKVTQGQEMSLQAFWDTASLVYPIVELTPFHPQCRDYSVSQSAACATALPTAVQSEPDILLYRSTASAGFDASKV